MLYVITAIRFGFEKRDREAYEGFIDWLEKHYISEAVNLSNRLIRGSKITFHESVTTELSFSEKPDPLLALRHAEKNGTGWELDGIEVEQGDTLYIRLGKQWIMATVKARKDGHFVCIEPEDIEIPLNSELLLSWSYLN